MSKFETNYHKKPYPSGFFKPHPSPKYHHTLVKGDRERSRSRSRERSPFRAKHKIGFYPNKFFRKSSYSASNKREESERDSKYEKNHTKFNYSSSGARPYPYEGSWYQTNFKGRNEFDERKTFYPKDDGKENMKKYMNEDKIDTYSRKRRDESYNSYRYKDSYDRKSGERESLNDEEIFQRLNSNGNNMVRKESKDSRDLNKDSEIHVRPFLVASPKSDDRTKEDGMIIEDSKPKKTKRFDHDDIIFQKTSSLSAQKKELRLDSESEFELESDTEQEKIKKKPHRGKEQPNKVPLNSSSRNTDPRARVCDRLNMKEKLNLVLDLDETIVNCAPVDRHFDIRSLKHIPLEYIKEMEFDRRRVLIILRPYYKEFLEKISKSYNIFAYSHGRWEYVQKLLHSIDKDEKYIRRDMIFKNTGQVDSKTQKLVANLGFSEEEAEKTIIVDDQKFIWGSAHRRVLASKKFIPLKDFMPEEKYMNYMLFSRKDENDRHNTWSISSKGDPQGLNLYAEFNLLTQTSSQLESLHYLLEGIAEEYNLKRLLYPSQNNKLKIESLIEGRLGKIMKGWKVGVVASTSARTTMFYDLIHMLGGTVVDPQAGQYVFVDTGLDDTQKLKIKDESERLKPHIKLVSVDWLIECFFSGHRVSLQNFPVRVLT